MSPRRDAHPDEETVSWRASDMRVRRSDRARKTARVVAVGLVWTAYAGSWQWDAQLVIGWLGFLTALWALYAAGRRGVRQTVASLGLSAALIATWIVWITVQPPAGKLA